MIKATVLYPNDGGKLDEDYYVNKHIPLAKKLLTPYGLVRIEVDKGLGTPVPGDPPPYKIIAHLVFKTAENMQKGLQAHDPDLAADVPNFTDIKPLFQISEIIVE